MIKIPNYECYEYHKESLRVYEQTKHLAVFQITEERAGLIRSALLDYRREHNIFEVGDELVEASYLDDTSNEIGIYDGKSFHGYTCVKFSETLVMADESDFRHATDAEIAAGYKL